MSIPGNSKLSERLAFLTQIAPVALATSGAGATVTSTLVSLAATTANTFDRLLAVVQGMYDGTTNVTVKVIANTANSATGATVLKSATLNTAAAGGISLIDFNVPQHLYASSPFIGIQVTGTTLNEVSALLIGADAKYEPVSAYNLSGTATPVDAA